MTADYETAWALAADELDRRRAAASPYPARVWRQAMLELAYRALGFDPDTGLKTQAGSFLGPTPTQPPTLDEVNALLARVGIGPLVTRELTPAEFAERWAEVVGSNPLGMFFGSPS